ncbi:MAG: phage tail protein [Campylobacter sputorum]|uniref:phage tail protein n=1 Tax=Campylobacter sputorum TaxID=206 RepID=UPI002A915A90|nr:phage tail protein [Campylobacter sputorum]MDY6120435.1 phage tail protein [Campylobacter sputorum]
MNEFYTLLTNYGIAKIVEARANKQTINLSHIAVGDGEIIPSESMTALKNEKHRLAINSIIQDSNNPSYLIIEGVIPVSVGGFYINEVGIFDDSGKLFAIGSLPKTYKPLLSEGSAKDLTLKITIEVTNTKDITLKVDDSVVLATRKWVLENNYTKAQSDELYPTKDDLKELETKISKVFTYKGSIESLEALNQIGKKTIGDVYSIGSDNYVWYEDKWNKLGGSVDLSSYATIDLLNSKLSTKADSGVSYTKAEVYSKTETNNLLNSKANNGVSYTKAEVYSKTETNNLLNSFATKTDITNININDLTARCGAVNYSSYNPKYPSKTPRRLVFSEAFPRKCFFIVVFYNHYRSGHSQDTDGPKTGNIMILKTEDKAGFIAPAIYAYDGSMMQISYIAFGY